MSGTSWLSPFTAIRDIVGGADLIPGVNNPFNGTTDGTSGTSGSWGDPAQASQPTQFTEDTTQFGQVGAQNVLGPNWQAQYDQQQAAKAQEAARQSSARNNFNQGRTNILDSIRGAAGDYVKTGGNNILNFVEGLRSQQQGLDTQRANAELGRRNASSGIQSMVGQGIRSFGVNLANRNAGDSSAALAGAQAYGRMGNQQMQDVNQQYGLENANLDVSQQNLDTSREAGLRGFDLEKEMNLNNWVRTAQDQFATLNAQAEGAGIMDRIAIEQEKESIKNQLLQQLAQLDARGQSASVRPMDQMGIQNKAQELSQLGQGGTQFDFTGTAPTQLQTGSPLGQLPIFSNRRRRD